MLEHILVPINRAGWPFIGLFLVASLLLAFVWQPLFWLGLIASAWCTFFFRDPPRVVPQRSGLVVAPADGRVTMVTEAVPPPELELGEGPLPRISIFLNVFDVHINRIPIAGRIARISYRHGKFLDASLDKASEQNERNALRIDGEDGRSFGLVQIAGLVARRIVCTVSEGESVATGVRFGLIRFGSRTDLYLPQGVAPLVAVGQRCVGGETVVADLAGQETARQGVRI